MTEPEGKRKIHNPKSVTEGVYFIFLVLFPEMKGFSWETFIIVKPSVKTFMTLIHLIFFLIILN